MHFLSSYFLNANRTLWRRFESATLKLGRDVKHFNFANRDVCKSCVIYKGDGSCGSRYIGEIKRNAEVRWNEHNNPTSSSEPSKHLRSNINHYFTWAVISNAPKNAKTRKNLEASYIALWKPDLNEQKDFERLVLFRNGVIKSN